MGRLISVAWGWLKTHNESIVALATTIQAVAVVFAVYQVALTKTQIEDARRGLQANVELQVQHDGRDLLGSLNPDILAYIYDNQSSNPEAEKAARLKIVQFLNYYASISRQHSMGAIDDGFWDTMKREFCFFLTHSHVRPFWDALVKSKNYPQAFEDVGNQCLANAVSPSP